MLTNEQEGGLHSSGPAASVGPLTNDAAQFVLSPLIGEEHMSSTDLRELLAAKIEVPKRVNCYRFPGTFFPFFFRLATSVVE